MTMLELVKHLNFAVVVLFTLLYLYQGFYVVVGLVCRRWQDRHQPSRLHRFAVIVSARNEEGVIGELLESLNRQNYPKELLDLYVVADNCTDDTAGAARRALERGEVPVLCDPEAAILRELPFDGVVDAILAKRNLGTAITDAPVVLALGPGFTAGVDCHGVVETMRGHDLGRLLTRGSAVPNTGVPGDVGGYTTQRIIRAPADGVFEPLAAIGQRVEEGQPVARVAGRTARAQLTGVVRGMLPAGLAVTAGMKAGDIDPRCRAEHCFTVSDKARAIGGGVLEGLLYFERRAGLWSV